MSVYAPIASLQCGSDSLMRAINSSLHIFVPYTDVIKSLPLRLSISIQNSSFLRDFASYSLAPRQPVSSSLKNIHLQGTFSSNSRQATIPHLSSPPTPCPLKLVNTSLPSNSGFGASSCTVSKWQQNTGNEPISVFVTVIFPYPSISMYGYPWIYENKLSIVLCCCAQIYLYFE